MGGGSECDQFSAEKEEYYNQTSKENLFSIGDFALWRDKGTSKIGQALRPWPFTQSKLGKLTNKFSGPFEIIKM